jgi:hypothetical protein
MSPLTLGSLYPAARSGTAQAGPGGDIVEELRQIVNSIGPSSDSLIWDLSLYVLFFLNFITLFMLPDGSTMGTMLTILVLISIFIDKTYAFGYMMNPGVYGAKRCHEEIFVGTYLIRAAMFVVPLTVAASTEDGKVRAVGVIAGIGGAIYLFLRWFMQQRNVEAPGVTCSATIGFVLLAAQMLRDRAWLGVIYGRVPLPVVGQPAAHDVEV